MPKAAGTQSLGSTERKKLKKKKNRHTSSDIFHRWFLKTGNVSRKARRPGEYVTQAGAEMRKQERRTRRRGRVHRVFYLAHNASLSCAESGHH